MEIVTWKNGSITFRHNVNIIFIERISALIFIQSRNLNYHKTLFICGCYECKLKLVNNSGRYPSSPKNRVYFSGGFWSAGHESKFLITELGLVIST